MRIKNAITLSDGKIYLNGEEILLPEKLVPPESVENIEIVYITEILKAYAETENIKDLTIDTLPDKYKKEIERHRQDFFNAFLFFL